MSKRLKFGPGLKLKANFHPKMSVRRQLEMKLEPQTPAIPTLKKRTIKVSENDNCLYTNLGEGKQAVYKHVTHSNDAVKMFRY